MSDTDGNGTGDKNNENITLVVLHVLAILSGEAESKTGLWALYGGSKVSQAPASSKSGLWAW